MAGIPIRVMTDRPQSGRRDPSAFVEQGWAWSASRSSTLRRSIPTGCARSEGSCDRSRSRESDAPAAIIPVSLLMAMPHRRTLHPAGCSLRPRACLLPL